MVNVKHDIILDEIRESDGGEEGEFDINNQSIPAGTTFTIEIPLNSAKYKMGNILLYVPQAVSSSWRRAHSYIMFTTDINNAMAQSTGRSTNMISLCVYYDWWVRGYAYSDDGFLSDRFYNLTGWNIVRIKSCQIIDDKIELVLENTHTAINANVSIRGNFHVFKT